MVPVAALVAGVWLFLQATSGRLAGRMLSWRSIRAGEVPAADVAGFAAGAAAGAGTSSLGSIAGAGPGASLGAIAGAAGGLAWPVHGPVTQEFGHNGHPGIDIGVPTGTPVGAPGGGTVVSAGWAGGCGNAVKVDHGAGIATRVCHLSSIAVTAGQTVTAGTVVGLAGSTGYSTGPHVHYELYVNGATVDPRSRTGGAP